MKIGDYVRTKNGYIHKITDLKPFYENDRLIKEKQEVYIDNKSSGWNYEQFEEFIIKSSPDIIDLIQVGDYVNGDRVVEHAHEPGRLFVENVYVGGKGQTTIENYTYELTSKYCYDEPDFIETILTKEQFKSMEYKVGDKE